MATAQRREQPPWTRPESSAPLPPLSIYNTLTRQKDPFVPLDKSGKKVTWYCCGPTVYDAAHLGHARNYVTTDIVRRIMRDYFGFNITFVQNVTDVDDKIILRARQQHLFEEYKTANPKITPEVLSTTEKAWTAYFTKIAKADEGDLTTTPSTFEAWATRKHEPLMALIHKELAGESVEGELLDEDAAKLKMHLNTLLMASKTLQTPPASADEFYGTCSSVLLPYIDSLNKDRTYEPAVFSKLSRYWENHFNEDMATLNVLPPTTVTRVSEFIPENVAFVQKLVDRGFAYPTADGSVYFDIAAYEAAGHHYAKLQPWNRGDQSLIADGEGALTSDKATTLPTSDSALPAKKKADQDFALWKASKAGEPSWESPWGQGRPGWHIECSVMCSEVLGGEIDIHSGGIDLAFPHHDNEIAQSEAYWDGCASHATADGKHQWINYFLHMGHLKIHGSKMSKSLKNFVSVRKALARGGGWTPRMLRIVFLQGGWKDGIEVREGVLSAAKSWETAVNKFFTNVKALVTEEAAAQAAGTHIPQPWTKLEADLSKELDSTREKLDAALCDSFNTPLAMQLIVDLISTTNIYMSATTNLALVKEIARWITRITTIFGLDNNSSPDRIGWTSEESSAGNAEEIAMPYLRLLSSFRDSVRALGIADPKSESSKELLRLCDKLRDIDLADLGVSLDDRDSANALIKFVPAEELRAAREEKERKAAEREQKKEEARLKREEEERKKLEQAKVDPTTMFRTEEWSEWDDQGIPTKDKEGEEITKSRKKALTKAWEQQKKKFDAYQKTLQK
ncbi:tRNA synthetases class I (C) catalytic domain-containing protein [Pyronema omphalodes]|nr:tRNA synthetases class I (C) catalytic domain-containing protein [Pyronema omphalodes]